MAIHGFMTVCCLGHYREVFEEILETLLESRLYERSRAIHLAVLGSPEQRAEVQAVIRPFKKFCIDYETSEMDEYEFPALALLQDFCKTSDAHVFYLHTKGVSHSALWQPPRYWRALMLHHVVRRHDECLEALTTHDGAGTNWRGGHYSGNFWWARAAHIRRLPDMRTLRHTPVFITKDPVWNVRLQCEFWLGMVKGRFANFGPQYMDLYHKFRWPVDTGSIAQQLLDACGGSRFLEVTTAGAGVFISAIRADVKHLVSPSAGATFAMTDRQFMELKLGEPLYDLILLDSSHEEAQCLAAMEWALGRISPRGAILVHDSNPPTEWHQRPASEYTFGTEWNGDVWKAVVRFRLRHPDLDVATVETDWGCTIIRPDVRPRSQLAPGTPNDLTYRQLELNRVQWLNLVSPYEFTRELTHWQWSLGRAAIEHPWDVLNALISRYKLRRYLELEFWTDDLFQHIDAPIRQCVAKRGSASFDLETAEFFIQGVGCEQYDLIAIEANRPLDELLPLIGVSLQRLSPGGFLAIVEPEGYGASTLDGVRKHLPDCLAWEVATPRACTLLLPHAPASGDQTRRSARWSLTPAAFGRWLLTADAPLTRERSSTLEAALEQARAHEPAETQSPKPLVSCILPTYNRRGFLPHALHYFLRQDYRPKELIVIDDGTDSVADLIPDHPSIRYIRLPSKITLGAKLNLGCEAALGDLIAQWDDDDWYAPDRLSRQVEVLNQRPEVDLCGISDLLYYDLHGNGHHYVYPAGQRPWVIGSSLFFRRSAWKRHRFVDADVGMDGAFAWSMPARATHAMADSSFAVHIIHSRNVNPKITTGPSWRPHPVSAIADVMGDDWQYYEPQGQPLPHPRPRALPTAAVSTSPRIVTARAASPVRNVYACLVHESLDCVLDLVSNLRKLDPDSFIIVYDGGEQTGQLCDASKLRKLDAVLHPTPRPMRWGHLHEFALDSMRYAFAEWSFDTVTIVDSDQLALRSGWCARLGEHLARHPNAGLLGNAPYRQLPGTTEPAAATAWREFELWRPYLRRFHDGESKFVHWTFWPSTVFTADAARELLRLFDHDRYLRNTLARSKLWATEEVLFPTLTALLGFDVVASPGTYEYVRYRVPYDDNALRAALAHPDAYWMHPVPRQYDHPLRRNIRAHVIGSQPPSCIEVASQL